MADDQSFSINQVTREQVHRAIELLDAGKPHRFGPPLKYVLVFNGRPYTPKAVLGLALEVSTGRSFGPDDFSGGKNHANSVLTKLGFTVLEIGDVGEDWTDDECRLVVDDYFKMLRDELLGRQIDKTEHRKRILSLIQRSAGSVEFKHQNISAVLNDLHQPYIRGYKPRGNRQGKLVEAVEGFLEQHQGFFDQPELMRMIEPETAIPVPVISSAKFFAEPPETSELPPQPPQVVDWRSRRGRRTDFVERDARNRAMGTLGERFAVELERRRLQEAGRDDLAGKVEHVAETKGDGLGFDVLSWDEKDDGERLLEVKTTTLGKYHPFMVTSNELAVSEAEPDRFHLYRVFDFSSERKVFVLKGALTKTCRLQPTQFRAVV